LSKLTLDEKIELLAGQGSFRMTGLERHGIPALIVSLTGNICEKKAQLTKKTDFRRSSWNSRSAIVYSRGSPLN
jgi:hypothetical protein